MTRSFPKVLSEVETARFFIIGARPSREVQELSALPGVSVVGAVKDIRPYLAYARAAVAPLRIARGVQNTAEHRSGVKAKATREP